MFRATHRISTTGAHFAPTTAANGGSPHILLLLPHHLVSGVAPRHRPAGSRRVVPYRPLV